MSMPIEIDAGAAYVVEILEKAGYEAYVVGGCVRDALMGAEPKDWDITTSARPEQVKELFPKTFDTGIEHGTVSVLHHHVTYEVTTYRVDGSYTDHRRPDAVTYTASLYEDVARRDFTINAMAYHPQRGLMDFFGGQSDLEAKRIRCVGEAAERFEEDALRMLRAIRFAARLGFSIEGQTLSAISQKAELLRHVSRERVADELTKTLLCDGCSGLQTIIDTGLYPWICAEFQGEKRPDFAAPRRVEARKALRWAAFLHPFGAEGARSVLGELKFDNATMKNVGHLLRFLQAALPQNARDMRFFLHELGAEHFEDLCALKQAVGLAVPEASRQAYETERQACVSLAQLAVSGRDLIRAGARSGKELGAMLEQLLELVMEQPQLNEPQALLTYFAENMLA